MAVSTKSLRSAGPRASPWRRVLGGLAVAFGAATVVEGGTTLFGGPEARAAAGAVVPFVVAFNFGAGFLYLAAGAAALGGRPLAVWLARALAGATLAVFLAFGAHVLRGGAYEARTVKAMTVRSLFWVVQAVALARVSARKGPA